MQTRENPAAGPETARSTQHAEASRNGAGHESDGCRRAFDRPSEDRGRVPRSPQVESGRGFGAPQNGASRRKEHSAGRFVVEFLLFGTMIGIAILLFLTALVVWLSSLTGSFIIATLILGGLFALLAMGFYLLSIREAVEQLRARAETVYEVARLARSGYEWVSDKVATLIGIYRLLRRG